jgi:hypothetical protein
MHDLTFQVSADSHDADERLRRRSTRERRHGSGLDPDPLHPQLAQHDCRDVTRPQVLEASRRLAVLRAF